MKKIRLLIADDHRLVRDGIVALLKNEPNYSIAGEASDGYEVLDKIKNIEVDVILLDINMPNMGGIETCKAVKAFNDTIEIVLLSMEASEELVMEGIAAGAKAYLTKDTPKSKLLQAIKTVYLGEKFFDETISQVIFENFYEKTMRKTPASRSGANLSKREKEVLILIAEGNTNRQIADKLFISQKTVETHRFNIMQKLGLKNAAQLVRYALKNGYTSV